MSIESRRGRAHSVADCVTCGEMCPSRYDKPSIHRSWARRHAEQNPGHSIHLVTSNLRVYEAQ